MSGGEEVGTLHLRALEAAVVAVNGGQRRVRGRQLEAVGGPGVVVLGLHGTLAWDPHVEGRNLLQELHATRRRWYVNVDRSVLWLGHLESTWKKNQVSEGICQVAKLLNHVCVLVFYVVFTRFHESLGDEVVDEGGEVSR